MNSKNMMSSTMQSFKDNNNELESFDQPVKENSTRYTASRQYEGDTITIVKEVKKTPSCKEISLRLIKIYGKEKKSPTRKIIEKARGETDGHHEGYFPLEEKHDFIDHLDKVSSAYNLTLQLPALPQNNKVQSGPVGLFSTQNTGSDF